VLRRNRVILVPLVDACRVFMISSSEWPSPASL
jgi:hypothetical protein